MEELDRKVAVEVMGEPQPLVAWPIGFMPAQVHLEQSPSWRWAMNTQRWKPLPFSSDLDTAMRAAEVSAKALGWRWIKTSFDTVEKTVIAWVNDWWWAEGRGSTLPEAICRLLLALVEKER